MNNDENGIGLPPPTRPAPPMPGCKPVRVSTGEAMALAACATLGRLGYTWVGGEEWKPPLGAVPKFMQDTLDRVNAAAGLKPLPNETACSFRNRILAQADAPLETSENEAKPYVAPTFHWEAPVASGQPLDANALERIARQLPDECFLKGSGVLKLTGGIRQLEAQIAELRKGQPAEMSSAARDVLAERRRQQEVEGWTPERDDKYINCDLARAAATYALCTKAHELKVCDVVAWPWPIHWWKPSTYRRNLEKAGALILAEIERLDRAAEKGGAA